MIPGVFSVRRAAVLIACALAALMALDGRAQAEPKCGAPYAIASGDTLPAIAEAAYGAKSAWTRIYEFRENAAVIGTNALTPIVGATIALPPCDFANVFFGEPLGEPPTVDWNVASDTTVEVLVNGRRDFLIARELPEWGMVAQLAQAAIGALDGSPSVRFHFIKDPRSHIDVLLRHRVFQIALAWAAPDCRVDTSFVTSLCQYDFSQPLYSLTLMLYGRNDGSAAPNSVFDLRDRTVCRGDDWGLFDALDPTTPLRDEIDIVASKSVKNCFERLRDGEVDYVFTDRLEGELAIARTGARSFVVEHPTVLGTRTLHFVAPPTYDGVRHPLLNLVDQGLDRIRETGMADAIISWHLARHRVLLIR